MIISIQPVQSWNRGTVTQLNTFKLQLIADNLKDTATFYWQIGNDTPTGTEVISTWVQDGNLTLSGTDYANWNGSNDAAMTWAIGELNLQRAQVGTVADIPVLKTTSLVK